MICGMTSRGNCSHRVFFIFITMLLPPAVAEPSGATIRGTVQTEDGVTPADARVIVIDRSTGAATRNVGTRPTGEYRIEGIPPGRYRIIGCDGDAYLADEKDEQLREGDNRELHFHLRRSYPGGAHSPAMIDATGTVSQPVASVAAAGCEPARTTADVSAPFDFTDFAIVLDPLVQRNINLALGSASADASATTQSAYTIHRLDTRDAFSLLTPMHGPEVGPPTTLNSFRAEFATTATNPPSTSKRSGTNELHGRAFIRLRDENFNAKHHFEEFDVFGNRVQRPKAPLDWREYGVTLGGPVRRGRTFFLAAAERLTQQAATYVNIDREPAAILDEVGFPTAIGAHIFNVAATRAALRIDHDSSLHQRFALQLALSRRDNEQGKPAGGLAAGSRAARSARDDVTLRLGHTSVFSPTVIAEGHVGFDYSEEEVLALDPICGGDCVALDQGGPGLELSGVASVGRHAETPTASLRRRWDAREVVTMMRGNHVFKGGMQFSTVRTRETLPWHFGGRYLFGWRDSRVAGDFDPLAALVSGLPSAYIQAYGNPTASYRHHDFAIFLQDDWTVSRRLRLSYGLRYERRVWPRMAYSVPVTGGARLQYELPQDGNDVAPRFTVRFDPKGNGRTLLRAGYARFFEDQISGALGLTQVMNGTDTGVRTLVARSSQSLPSQAWLRPSHRLPEDDARALLGGEIPSLTLTLSPVLETPYSDRLILGLDQELTSYLSFHIEGQYSRGQHQVGVIDYNPIVPALGEGRRPSDKEGIAGTSAPVLQVTDFGDTWYRAVSLTLLKRFQSNYRFGASYTLSDMEDTTNGSLFGLPERNGRGRDPNAPTALPIGFAARNERGPAAQDQRHRFVFDGLYQFSAGITAVAVLTATSGGRFTPLVGEDLNGDGDGWALPGPDRARRDPQDEETAVRRNSERLPAQLNLDFRLSKAFRFASGMTLELSLDAANLLDRANFVGVNNIFGPGSFPNEPARDQNGRITYRTYTASLPPRQMQFAATLSF